MVHLNTHQSDVLYYGANWLWCGWCHAKPLPSWCMFCPPPPVVFIQPSASLGEPLVIVASRSFAESAHNFYTREILGLARSLSCNGHTFTWWPCLFVHNFGFPELVLSLGKKCHFVARQRSTTTISSTVLGIEFTQKRCANHLMPPPPAWHLIIVSNHVANFPVKILWGCLMFSPCLEPQGCHLIPHFYMLCCYSV